MQRVPKNIDIYSLLAVEGGVNLVFYSSATEEHVLTEINLRFAVELSGELDIQFPPSETPKKLPPAWSSSSQI